MNETDKSSIKYIIINEFGDVSAAEQLTADETLDMDELRWTVVNIKDMTWLSDGKWEAIKRADK